MISDMFQICQQGQRNPLVSSHTGLRCRKTQRLADWMCLAAARKSLASELELWPGRLTQAVILDCVQALVSKRSPPAKQSMPESICQGGTTYKDT